MKYLKKSCTLRMQQANQEMRFTEDPFLHEGKKVGYLNPLRISENEHTVVMGPNHDRFVGKREAKIAKIRVEEQDKQETAVATYIGNTSLEWQRQGMRSCPIKLPVCWSLTPLTILVYKVTVLTHALIKFVQRPLDLRPLDLYTDLS